MDDKYRQQAEAFAEHLISLPKARKRMGNRVTGRCVLPEHEDKHPSFGYDIEKDAWACSCGGGKGSDLMKALGWVWSGATRPQEAPRGPRRTDYKILDIHGALVATHVRWDKPDGTKAFTWEKDGKPTLNGTSAKDLPLYGIHDAIGKAGVVYVCEGEKAANALRDRGISAVATVCGASSTPSRAVLETLKDKYVVLWPDADEPGHRHMDAIAQELTGLGIIWEMVSWPGAKEGDDAYDYFQRGGSIDGLSALSKGPPTFDDIVGAKTTPLNELAHLIDQEIEYAIRPICPRGALTMIQGMPKGGKSTFSLWLGLCAAMGNWPSGVFEIKKPLKVLFVEYEDRPILVVKRASKYLAGAGFDPKILPCNLFLSDNPTLWLDSAKYEAALKAEIKAQGYDLVVIDTLSYIHQAESENDAADMKILTASLKRIVAETGCNITFLHHVGKGSKDKAVSEAARGSSVIPACADVILHWGDRGDGDVTPLSITSKYDDGFRCSVEYVRGDEGVSWKVEKEEMERRRGEDGQEQVLGVARQLLVSNPMGVKGSDLVKLLIEMGTPRRTAYRHLQALSESGKLAQRLEGKVIFYALGGMA